MSNDGERQKHEDRQGGKDRQDKPQQPLRRGWTTGACATAAAKAAWQALLTGEFPDPVSIRLPRGATSAFALTRHELGVDWASASVIKDAGDDPDVTHGAEITARVTRGQPGDGVTFKAGPGVGTVTLAGLPLPVGQPAINPVPREMMREAISEVSTAEGASGDAKIEISVKNGAEIAKKTWNPRLGIVGGLSILGTTGIVVPYSCAAWIHSIHRGVDVARAAGLTHIAGATGNMSEIAVRNHYDLADIALIDMGDFAGGLFKYLRKHPIDRLTIAGGFAKLTKLAQGALDLHSSRSEIDLNFLSELVRNNGGSKELALGILSCNTAAQALEMAREDNVPLADFVATKALDTAGSVLVGASIKTNVLVVDRSGMIIADSDRQAA